MLPGGKPKWIVHFIVTVLTAYKLDMACQSPPGRMIGAPRMARPKIDVIESTRGSSLTRWA